VPVKRIIIAILITLVSGLASWAAEEKIELFPSTPYDQYIIYQNLTIFWAGIIGLITIIRMKLREIKRIQKLGIDKEEKDVPLLD